MTYFPTILLLTVIVFASYFISMAYGESTVSKIYFKDGKIDENRDKVYTLDYATTQYDSNSALLRTEPIKGSNAIVTDTQIQLKGAMKGAVPDNPNAYDVLPMDFVLDIKRVEAINGGQLNNYTIDSKSDFTYQSFTETSPTTATLTSIFDLSAFNKSYFSTDQEEEYNTSDLERQL